jgi:UDPglucose 6-dehydrogenase
MAPNGKPVITFVGAGYVGLPWAAIFANWGYQVYALDVDEKKIERINKGEAPFEEPGLTEMIAKVVKEKKLIATTDYAEAIPKSNIVFICVGTPSNAKGEADMGYVFSAAEKIAQNLGQPFTVIVDRSTVPPGTVHKVRDYITKARKDPQKEFAVVSSPEFLRQGHAIEDTLHPSRIIIGSDDPRAIALLTEIHGALDCPKVVMSAESAEIVKYAANAYLAMRIVFADQMSNLAEAVGADIKEVIAGTSLDPRIGDHFWYPGLGYGGYCFPKDVKALASSYQANLNEPNLFSILDELNEARIERICQLAERQLNGLTGHKIVIWGLSAKPQSPDMRGSTPANLIKALADRGAIIHAYDPYAWEEASGMLKGMVQLHRDHMASLPDSDGLFILTEHQEFKNLDYRIVKDQMRGKLLFDAKRVLDRDQMRKIGFDYWGIGDGKGNKL